MCSLRLPCRLPDPSRLRTAVRLRNSPFAQRPGAHRAGPGWPAPWLLFSPRGGFSQGQREPGRHTGCRTDRLPAASSRLSRTRGAASSPAFLGPAGLSCVETGTMITPCRVGVDPLRVPPRAQGTRASFPPQHPATQTMPLGQTPGSHRCRPAKKPFIQTALSDSDRSTHSSHSEDFPQEIGATQSVYPHGCPQQHCHWGQRRHLRQRENRRRAPEGAWPPQRDAS